MKAWPKMLRDVAIPLSAVAMFRVSWIIHEIGHWVFIVPFGGSFYNWHWYSTHADIKVPSPRPWITTSYYAGGISAFVFLSALFAFLAIPRIWRASNLYWWLFGAILSFSAFLELGDGILEGGFPSFYCSCLRTYLLLLLSGSIGLFVYSMAFRKSSAFHMLYLWRMVRAFCKRTPNVEDNEGYQ